MRPLSSLRATMRTSPAGRSSGELASQRLTVAVVGKKRTRGSWRSPQVLSGWRCWRPNSMRPLSSLRATIRTVVLSPAVLSSWAAAAVDTTAPLRTASRATSAAAARRRLPRGPLRAAGTFVEAGRDGIAFSSDDRALPLHQPGGSSPIDITDTPDIAGCAVWPMAGSRGEDRQEPCHTGISTPRGGPWRTSNVDGILRSLRLTAEAGGDRSESAASRPRSAPRCRPSDTPPTRVAPERRPALGPALEAFDVAGAALVVARLDRVTRSLLAWAELVERSRRRGWAIVVVAAGFDLSTDSGELTAALLAALAQYERRLSGARTREAMAAARRGAPGTAAPSSTPPRRATSWGHARRRRRHPAADRRPAHRRGDLHPAGRPVAHQQRRRDPPEPPPRRRSRPDDGATIVRWAACSRRDPGQRDRHGGGAGSPPGGP